jgi:excisionase family DNA binding protein
MSRTRPKKTTLNRSDSPIGILYSTDEVAAFVGVTARTVQRWIREKKLPAVFIGGTYRVKREDLQAFVKER